MSIYAIGDVQGCFFSLQSLLRTLDFSPSRDTLWFAGDLINRGPHSLKTARFVQSLGNSALCVLGNHELALLAMGYDALPNPPKHTLEALFNAPDKSSLLEWFRAMPLVHREDHHLLAHAGLYPFWSPEKAIRLAQEVVDCLRSPDYFHFLTHLFGDQPDTWQDTLSGMDRLRFIANAFTRMRYCSTTGALDLKTKESSKEAALGVEGWLPWFELLTEHHTKNQIFFGHWAALKGQCSVLNVHALDTGCVWKNNLTAIDIQSLERISVPCAQQDQ